MSRKVWNPDGRGEKRPNKIMYDVRGIGQKVPYAQWEEEVVNNPTGPTALRAQKENDKDLEKIQVDVIRIKHGSTKVDDKPKNMPLVTRRKDTVTVKPTLTEEEARKRGFISAEEGSLAVNPKTTYSEEEKKEKQKRKVNLLRSKQKGRRI